MNALYPKLANKTIPKILKRFGQTCVVRSAEQTGYASTYDHDYVGEKTLCVVFSTAKGATNDAESPIALEEGHVSILLQATVKPEKGGSIEANNRIYRIVKQPVELIPAGLAIIYRVVATANDIAETQLHPFDLKFTATMFRRVMRGNLPNQAGAAVNDLIEVNQFNCALETKAAWAQVTGITVKDKITHVIYVRYVDMLDCFDAVFDVNAHMIEIDGGQYRIDAVENMNEANKSFAVYLIRDTYVDSKC